MEPQRRAHPSPPCGGDGGSQRGLHPKRDGQHEPLRPPPRLAFTAGNLTQSTREIAEEVPVAFTYRGSTQAVMMASPSDLEDFAYGFTLNEGIVARPQDILSVTAEESGGGIDLQIELAGDHQAALTARRRAMAGPVGAASVASNPSSRRCCPPAMSRPRSRFRRMTLPKLRPHSPPINRSSPPPARYTLPLSIALAMACCWFREDVGRHNALDKLCGAMARAGIDVSSGAIVLTSRVSVEMVQKTAMAGAGMLIAISAPTALAIRMAEAAGITLVALARDMDFEIFTHTARVATQTASKRDADVA